MDLLKSQFERIQSQLAALTASQRMLVASLVVIMVMSLFYWTKYAATAEMEPVLDQSFSQEDVRRVASFLRARGFEVKVVGDQVLVPAERKLEAGGALTYDGNFSQDTASGFDKIIKQMNPFDSAAKTEVMWNEAKQLTLAQYIRQWPNVAWASVVLDQTPRRTTIVDPVKPSAAVTIKTRGGRPDKKLANSAVRLVAGGVAGMDPSRVSVIIDGVPVNAQDADQGMAGADNLFELKREKEKHYETKIAELLSFMRAPVIAKVTVDVSGRAVTQEKTTVDAKNSLHKPIKETNTSEEMKSAQTASAEPGASANIQSSVDGPGAAGERQDSTKSEEKNEYVLIPSQTTEKSTEGPGKETVLGAAVRVPRSYFVAVWKRDNSGAAKEPDTAALQPVVDAELPKLREDVRMCVGLADAKGVSVELYSDVPMDGVGDGGGVAGGLAQAPATGVVSVVLGGHAKEIAVGALAVVSLFMVSMMVKRSAPTPVAMPAKVAMPPPEPLEAGEQLAGEAGDGNPLLEAMEMDDDAVKTQQMIGQVSQMVKDNPDAAANLVKRWLNRS